MSGLADTLLLHKIMLNFETVSVMISKIEFKIHATAFFHYISQIMQIEFAYIVKFCLF
jgi:hypothetical protein